VPPHRQRNPAAGATSRCSGKAGLSSLVENYITPSG
jgi:hypothetical protein